MTNKNHGVALGLLALMTLGGCASINDRCYEKTQTARAIKEYIHCGNPGCSRYPHDYKRGWIDGFYEVATGGEPTPPAVAPSRYWNPEQILEDCDNRRHAYYSGWQDGACRAGRFPDTHYLKIYETCEKPFPRCDKPCADGTCGPCMDPFIGMSGMIESVHAFDVPPTPLPSPPMFESGSMLEAPLEDVVLPPAPRSRKAEQKVDDREADAAAKPVNIDALKNVDGKPGKLPQPPAASKRDDSAHWNVRQAQPFEMVVDEQVYPATVNFESKPEAKSNPVTILKQIAKPVPVMAELVVKTKTASSPVAPKVSVVAPKASVVASSVVASSVVASSVVASSPVASVPITSIPIAPSPGELVPVAPVPVAPRVAAPRMEQQGVIQYVSPMQLKLPSASSGKSETFFVTESPGLSLESSDPMPSFK